MNVQFISSLITVDVDDNSATLLYPLAYSIDSEDMVVPTGFMTNFASVPRIPVAFLLAGGIARRAAVIHDWLYHQHYDRKWADEVFLAAMKADGVPAWRRQLMYAAVRLFGRRAWQAK